MSARAFGVIFSPDRIDRDAGVIHGVSVVTAGRANGGYFDRKALEQIKACCESFVNGLKVVDRHTKGTDSIFATAGILRKFRIEGDKLLADLHLLKTEPNAAKLLEMAEVMPDTFGLSVAFSGVDEIINGETHWRCSEIYNAALVDVPAANAGLFSKVLGSSQVHFVDASAKPNAAILMSKTTGAEGTNIGDSTGANVSPDNLTVRVKQLEDIISAMEKKLADYKPNATECAMADLKKEIKTFSDAIEAKLADVAKVKADEVAAVAQKVAKEFAANTGTSAKVATDGAGNGGDVRKVEVVTDNAGTAKAFAALAVKKFAECKSKVKAVQLAMAEDPKGYEAFRASGLNINYS